MSYVKKLSIGSLFAGIGGLELGLEWAGHGPIRWQVEQDPWCRSVLAAHWPDAERFEDVRHITELAPVDLICGGFPCQDVSCAGAGAGLDGARSGLWWEFARIVGELRPPWVVVENVAHVKGPHWLDPVRRELEELGYETLPIPIAAADVGAPHQRDRVFLVARREAVADAHGEQLRDERQRGSGGRARRVRPQGLAKPAHHGGSGTAPGVEGTRGDLTDRCHCPRDESGQRASAWPPVPPVRGVDDGPASRLDKARLRSLGNAVVPQCAQVVGEVINLLGDVLEDTCSR